MVEGSRVDVAAMLGEFATEVQRQSDTESTLMSIVEGAVTIIPGARWAGISMINGRVVEARAPSHQLVWELDSLQTALDEGPCLSALRDHHTVHIVDMSAETRWPRFTSRAVELGVLSMLSFQLFVNRENLGALNLYAGVNGVFQEDSFAVGEVLAQHASIALASAVSLRGLQAALIRRDIIGQAKGILMHREKLTDMQAFQLLLKTSQNANIKLIDIAQWVVDQHLEAIGHPMNPVVSEKLEAQTSGDCVPAE